jgi:hypothetical protein
MNNLMTAKKYLPVALALIGFAVAGTAPAFAQSFNSEIGTSTPGNESGSGGEGTSGGGAIGGSGRQLAARQSGLAAFAAIPRVTGSVFAQAGGVGSSNYIDSSTPGNESGSGGEGKSGGGAIGGSGTSR